MVRLITLISFIFLTGCHLGSNNTVRTVVVKVPVNQCPITHNNIEKPQRPMLAIETITQDDKENPGKVVKMYKAAIKQLQGYSLELENGFEAYRNICREMSETDETK